MKTRVLFIASLKTRRQRFDGERVKSSFMFKSLNGLFNLTTINLSRFKVFNTLRILFYVLFCKKRFKKVIISKDPHGANIILKIFRFAHYSMESIIYFEIGPFLYDRIINKTIKRETFHDILIIVETKSMKDELLSLGFNNVDIFPNFKTIINIELSKKSSNKKQLRLVYFSRIDEMKGIFDLLDSIKTLNKNQVIFYLDVFGKKSINYDEDKFKSYLNNCEYIKYKGTMDIQTIKDYEKLSTYDLHVFPTKYSEGFPGTLIDFFIAGVPTLSSTFARAKDILTDDDSFFFEIGNKEDMMKQLLYIYNHQDLLAKKSIACLARKNEFSVEKFEQYCKNLLE